LVRQFLEADKPVFIWMLFSKPPEASFGIVLIEAMEPVRWSGGDNVDNRSVSGERPNLLFKQKCRPTAERLQPYLADARLVTKRVSGRAAFTRQFEYRCRRESVTNI